MLDDTTKRVLEEVATVAGKVGGGEQVERPGHHLEISALFDRCRSTFGAVWLLADRGFGQEAVLLTRGLFTDSLTLMELAAAGEVRRIEIVIGRWLASIDSLAGVKLEAQTRGDDASAELAGLAPQRAKLEDYARRHGASTRHWQADEKALADKHGRDDYLSFRIAHHFVHGTSFAAAQRYSRHGDAVVVGGPAADTRWAQPAVLYAASSLVYAIAAVSTILGLPQPPELESLHERIEARGKELGLT